MNRAWTSPWRCLGACTLLLAAAAPVLAEDAPAAGVVRISKPAAVTVRAQSDMVIPAGGQSEVMMSGTYCPNGDCDFGNGYPRQYKYGWNRDHDSGYSMIQYFRCKFGYFIPTGNGGAGAPFMGTYARVYPQDPGYFDQRDGQLWAAQGYGVPVAVPLAPVVGHQYNYSWGTPSSRLTPISRLAPQ
ncbi:MAG: hypothetical protein Q8K78_09820 [Planctomycetaceae bacterium]|nr:hypothetical protein [Planctomycetaceae bacterium]